MRPIVNVDDVELAETGNGEEFRARIGAIADPLGARKLGARLVVVPPGSKAWPLHNHHANEEMFVVLEGSGTLRYGTERHSLRRGDVVVARCGGAETAHQIVNDSSAELRYLAISTMLEPEICQYPDSGKLSALAGSPPGRPGQQRSLQVMTRPGRNLDYWDGES